MLLSTIRRSLTLALARRAQMAIGLALMMCAVSLGLLAPAARKAQA